MEDDEFVTLLNSVMLAHSFSNADVARKLTVSNQTVNCWINGKCLPHQAIREPILKRLVFGKCLKTVS